MEQFECVLQRIKVLQGVNYGLVNTTDVEVIAEKEGIEQVLMSDLYCYLRNHGVEVYSEEYVASALVNKKPDRAQSSRTRQFKRADEGLEKLLTNDMDETYRQAWIRSIEKSRSENLKAVFMLKREWRSASEIATALNCTVDEVYRLEYCICNRLRMVGHSHKSAKRIRDFYE